MHSQDKWTGDAQAAYDDYVKCVEDAYSNPNINLEDEAILDNMINTVTTEFSTFLNRFYTKCSVVADNNASRDTTDSTQEAAAAAEKAREAEIVSRLDCDMIDEECQQLDTAIKKFKDWSLCEDYEIEIGCAQISSWRKAKKELENKLYTIKKQVELHSLDETRLVATKGE